MPAFPSYVSDSVSECHKHQRVLLLSRAWTTVIKQVRLLTTLPCLAVNNKILNNNNNNF